MRENERLYSFDFFFNIFSPFPVVTQVGNLHTVQPTFLNYLYCIYGYVLNIMESCYVFSLPVIGLQIYEI